MMVEQIYRRKSVRKFKDVPIPREAAQALITWREWVHPAARPADDRQSHTPPAGRCAYKGPVCGQCAGVYAVHFTAGAVGARECGLYT